jgi:hypothetical protein
MVNVRFAASVTNYAADASHAFVNYPDQFDSWQKHSFVGALSLSVVKLALSADEWNLPGNESALSVGQLTLLMGKVSFP